MSTINNIDTMDNQNPIDIPINNKVPMGCSAFYYVMLAAMSNLDSSKKMINSDDESQEVLAMLNVLQDTKDMDEKKALIDFDKAQAKESGDTMLLGMLNGAQNQLQAVQDQINEAADEYKKALEKIDPKYKREEEKHTKKSFWKKLKGATKEAFHIVSTPQRDLDHEILTVNEDHKKYDKEKNAKINEIKATLNKPNKTEADLAKLDKDFKDLYNIMNTEYKKGWFVACGDWFDKKAHQNFDNAKSPTLNKQDPSGSASAGAYILGGLEYLFGEAFAAIHSMTGDSKNQANDIKPDKDGDYKPGKVQAYIDNEKTLFDTVEALSQMNIDSTGQFIDRNKASKDAYVNTSKQTDELAKSVSQL